MKKKQILSVLLVVMILACSLASILSVQGAGQANYMLMGDANVDGRVNILDVTAIQRCLNELAVLPEDGLARARVTGGETLTIDDATAIQRYLAEFENPFNIGNMVEEPIPADKPQLLVDKVTADPGDTNVAVTVSVKNNPGIASLAFDVMYNTDALTLTDFAYNTDVTNGSSTVPFNANAFPTCLSMVNGSKNIYGDWVFATLYFEVKPTAKGGIYNISLVYDEENIYNIDETDVAFYVATGYIQVSGAEETEPAQQHTVTFVDGSGNVIEEQTVADGAAPAYPTPPEVPGYVFKGWDKTLDVVTGDTVITAIYELSTTEPTFVLDSVSAKAGDTNVAVKIALKNNPGIASALLEVLYDKDNLTLTGFDYNEEALAGSSTVPFNPNAFAPCLNMVCGTKNLYGDWVFATLYFDVDSNASGTFPISVSYDADNVYNIDEENIPFGIAGGSINVK